MAAKLKLLILLVALVALPLRGLAAVAMCDCAQDHHEKSALLDGHDHYDQNQADHSHGQGGAADGDPAGLQGSPAASSCSACAACCVGGAVAPAAWDSFSLAPAGASVIAFVEQGFTGVVPEQLERPPLARSL